MIICTEYQHLCISLSLWFSLLVVVGAIPRRGSWSTAGGGRGWGLNVQQYYQVRSVLSVLSGEILLDQSNSRWGRRNSCNSYQGETCFLTYSRWINQLTHSKSSLQIPMNYPNPTMMMSEGGRGEAEERAEQVEHHQQPWGSQRKVGFLSIYLLLHIYTTPYFPLDCSGSLGEGSRWVRWQVW